MQTHFSSLLKCIFHINCSGRISFFREARTGKGEVQPNPICNLNISLPGDISPDHSYTDKDIMAIQVHKPTYLHLSILLISLTLKLSFS